MKKLTALLLALSLTLALTSCTPGGPAPSPDPSTLAETYISELRAIFTAADIQPDPDASAGVHSNFTYDESFDPPTLESTELYYTQIGFDGAFELASAAYAAVVEQYGEPNDDHPLYSIQGLLDLNTTPGDEATYFDWWTLPDRTLTLNIRFLHTRPSTFSVTLTLEPLSDPLPEPPTAPSHTP